MAPFSFLLDFLVDILKVAKCLFVVIVLEHSLDGLSHNWAKNTLPSNELGIHFTNRGRMER